MAHAYSGKGIGAAPQDQSGPAPAAPGRQTSAGAGAPVQRKIGRGGGAPPPGDVRAAAARGVATPASALPYASVIQRLFGRHDISSVRAHVGPDAAAAAAAIGATAYAHGEHVVLGDHTDLHTVAHETAHVIQQRGGVSVDAGVGAAGDRYEQHADAVAQAVVDGRSAESLLDDATGGAGGGSGAVQRKITGFSYTEVKAAPTDVIEKVTEKGELGGVLSKQQLALLCDLINLSEELSIEEVRQRLRNCQIDMRDDRHDKHDKHEKTKKRDEKEKGRDDDKRTDKRKDKRKDSDDSSSDDEGFGKRSFKSRPLISLGSDKTAGFEDFVSTALPGMLKAMLGEPSLLGQMAEMYGVDDLVLAAELVRHALGHKLRPVELLLGVIAGMSPAELDELVTDVKSNTGGGLLADYDTSEGGATEAIGHALELQYKFYASFSTLAPPAAADLLLQPKQLLLLVADRHPDPQRVIGHVVAILRRVIQNALGAARRGSELPMETTALLQAAQPLDEQQVLEPGEIIQQTPACTFGRLMMFCSIGGRPPDVSGPSLEHALQGKSLEEHVKLLVLEDVSISPVLKAKTPVKLAQTMIVPGFGAYVRIDCKSGLCWVPATCVQRTKFDYTIPTLSLTSKESKKTSKSSKEKESKESKDQDSDEREVPLFGPEDVPLVEHVKQGGLGNCYLMSGLISIVAHSPKLILDLVCPLDDHTVAIRFFVRDRKTEKLSAEWIRVDRRVVLCDGKAKYAKTELALWPALIEKAYGVLAQRTGGGLESTGQGGQTSSVFTLLLGTLAVSIEVANPEKSSSPGFSAIEGVPPNPLMMTADQLVNYFVLPAKAARAFADAAEKERKKLEQRPGGSEDRGAVIEALHRIAELIGLDKKLVLMIEDYVTLHIPARGTSGGEYSKRAQMMHACIHLHLLQGGVVAFGSKTWSSDHHGPSGEPLSEMGLAGQHAYAVLHARIDDNGRLMLVIRNPWGRMGMKYNRSNKLLTSFSNSSLGSLLKIPVLDRVQIEDAEFEIDIEDVIRFFSHIYLG